MNQSRALLTLAAISILVIGMLPAQSFALEDEIEIKVEIKDGITEIEIETQELKAEFELDTTNEDEIIAAIMEFVDLSADQIRDVWKFEFEHDDEIEREDKFEDEDEFGYYEEHDKEFDGVYYDDIDRERDYEFDRERDYEFDRERDYEYDRERDYEFDREQSNRAQECLVDEDREVIIGDEECILKVFGEIPKQDCIINAVDGLIWYEKDCVSDHYEPKRDHPRDCFVEEDDSVVVFDEECLLQTYDKIPHLDCAKFEDGLVFYEKECTYKQEDKRSHDEPSDSESQTIIHELQAENKLLKENIHELEQQIKDLNQLLREQLRIIYEWITSR